MRDIEDIRAEHVEKPFVTGKGSWCPVCAMPWPCDVAIVLDEHDIVCRKLVELEQDYEGSV